MIKFGSIGQFKNIVKHVRDNAKYHGTPLPTIKFTGTTKLHGTNFGIRLDSDDAIRFQSREREISIESDNAGSAMFGERNVDLFRQTFANVLKARPDAKGKTILIYAEFCAGNIQKAVALNQLEKMCVVFNITICDGEEKEELSKDEILSCLVKSEEARIFCVYDFKTWEIDIDFNNPVAFQNQLFEWTTQVGDCCPVGKYFGVEGVGEGIVFSSDDFKYRFKVKDDRHVKGAHKVHTVKEVSPAEIERMNSIAEFVDTMVTEARLYQGIDKMKELGHPLENKSTSSYIKWCVQDTMKEEKDVIIASGFDVKEVMPKVSEKVKNFWCKYLEENT
jgi:hypothetical protein